MPKLLRLGTSRAGSVPSSSNPFAIRVVAPAPSGLPSWADASALPENRFIEFTLNYPYDVHPFAYQGLWANWVGGCFVPDYSPRGGLAYHGGGEHTSSWSDWGGVVMLNCDTRLFEWKCRFAELHHGVHGSPGLELIDAWGAYENVPGGHAPQTWHTYNSLKPIPASWGTVGSRGGIIRLDAGGYTDDTGSYGFEGGWAFDLSQTVGGTTKITGSQRYNFGRFNEFGGDHELSAAIDYIREGWWSAAWRPPDNNRLAFTSKTGVVTNLAAPAVPHVSAFMLHHFADEDLVVALINEGEIKCWTPGEAAWTSCTVNFTTTPVGYPNPGANFSGWYTTGLAWSTILGCFVGFEFGVPSSTQCSYWKLQPPPAGSRKTGTWVSSFHSGVIAYSPDGNEATNVMLIEDPGNDTGLWGKVQECPSLRAFVYSRSSNYRGQLIRLPGML